MSSTTPVSSRRRSSGADRPHQLAGLGIRNFPSMDTNDPAAQVGDADQREQEVTLPVRLGHGLSNAGGTPSPRTRYSPRIGSGSSIMATPPSPGTLYPFSQHGSSLSKFKSQSQVPSSPRLPFDHGQPATPTPRVGSIGNSFGADHSPTNSGSFTMTGQRPTLMRTPPTDHPPASQDEYDAYNQEEDEEHDSVLPDLPMSPARFALTSQFPRPDYGLDQDGHGNANNVFGGGDLVDPLSPRFGTYDPPLTPRNSIPHGRTGSIGGDGRIHARNLSLFFPQPGAEARVPGSPKMQGEEAPVTDIPSKTRRKVGLGGDGSFSFGRGAMDKSMPPPSSPEPKVVGRRGHHHKHSLSHNFFSFLDPTVTNPDLANLDAAPRPMATNHIGGTRSSPNLATAPILPSPISNPTTSSSWIARMSNLSSKAQMTLGFGALEFFVGASIWVKGQGLGSVGLTGLGYLVVFDALGVWVKLWSEVIKSGDGSTSSAEKPFGAHRKESMLYFVQSIFLLFSATYIAKEALEIALMSGSGSGGGGHGHGHAHGHGHEKTDQHGADWPLWLLASGALAVLLSATTLQNHAKLVEAVGPAVMPLRLSPVKVARAGDAGGLLAMFELLLANPFSLAILSCISVMLLGNLGLAPHQMLKLERVMAFIEAGVAFWLAYPSSLVFGQVLLQTAPPQQTVQMLSFKKAVEDIKDHPSVLRMTPPHIWQLTPHDPRLASTATNRTSSTPGSTPAHSRRPSFDKSFSTASLYGTSSIQVSGSQVCIMVANLTVCVRDDLEDKAILDLTRYCYERCSEAIRARPGIRLVEATGEVTIVVKREKELAEEADAAEHDKHHQHDHDHDHHHHHHAHSHTHAHAHTHSHTQTHTHTHQDDPIAKHDHDHAHHTHHDNCSHGH